MNRRQALATEVFLMEKESMNLRETGERHQMADKSTYLWHMVLVVNVKAEQPVLCWGDLGVWIKSKCWQPEVGRGTYVIALAPRVEKEKACQCELEQQASNGAVGATGPTASLEKIPQPQGTAGNKGYSLQTEVLIGNAKKNELYLAICNVRGLAIAAQLDWWVPFWHEPKDDITKIYRTARESREFLKQFDGCWPVDEIIAQHF
ncbi:hypothetical protein PUNSTDRAFT_42635 [Punctularia strigosozonata HHB-11173 SS5]|uniref:uncharacterized protein n=1 Tax=Punctularia strigosozonata (strain HHB-11173) TaxID=741275 RepID=UPI00044186A6|nr:uncharacterized protein PUNSTDRAFT_42635 [Punctularia strigosozonata HHB-11173 SS5]EIN11345.1 hypothetical protein PUNSTDRAFT_42635 [Punctularia strigosozonata HHB-11173 SS5]